MSTPQNPTGGQGVQAEVAINTPENVEDTPQNAMAGEEPKWIRALLFSIDISAYFACIAFFVITVFWPKSQLAIIIDNAVMVLALLRLFAGYLIRSAKSHDLIRSAKEYSQSAMAGEDVPLTTVTVPDSRPKWIRALIFSMDIFACFSLFTFLVVFWPEPQVAKIIAGAFMVLALLRAFTALIPRRKFEKGIRSPNSQS